MTYICRPPSPPPIFTKNFFQQQNRCRPSCKRVHPHSSIVFMPNLGILCTLCTNIQLPLEVGTVLALVCIRLYPYKCNEETWAEQQKASRYSPGRQQRHDYGAWKVGLQQILFFTCLFHKLVMVIIRRAKHSRTCWIWTTRNDPQAVDSQL